MQQLHYQQLQPFGEVQWLTCGELTWQKRLSWAVSSCEGLGRVRLSRPLSLLLLLVVLESTEKKRAVVGFENGEFQT